MKRKNILLITIAIAVAFSLGVGVSILLINKENTPNKENGAYVIKDNTEEEVEDEMMENQETTSDDNLNNEQITNTVPSNV